MIERKIIMNMKWFKAADIRALKTTAQTAVASIITSALISGINWIAIWATAILAGILSLITSLAGLPEVKGEYHGNKN